MKHKKTAGSFVLNIQKAMRVAGRNGGRQPVRMTQTELSEAAGVARSTLAHHRERSADQTKSANPTLEKICRIAETLNVPPAFLLMRPEDWTRLAQAIDFYARLRETRRGHALMAEIAGSRGLTPTAQSELAFELARRLGIDGRIDSELLASLPPDTRADVEAQVESRRLSIYATSSLPPISHMQPDEKIAAFIVSVIFGAHFRAEH